MGFCGSLLCSSCGVFPSQEELTRWGGNLTLHLDSPSLCRECSDPHFDYPCCLQRFQEEQSRLSLNGSHRAIRVNTMHYYKQWSSVFTILRCNNHPIQEVSTDPLTATPTLLIIIGARDCTTIKNRDHLVKSLNHFQ